MKKIEKEFDCVEMKRAGAQRIHEALKGKSHEERMAYWATKNAEIRSRFADLRTLDDTEIAHR